MIFMIFNHSFIVVSCNYGAMMEDEKSSNLSESQDPLRQYFDLIFHSWFGGKNNGLPLIMKTH